MDALLQALNTLPEPQLMSRNELLSRMGGFKKDPRFAPLRELVQNDAQNTADCIELALELMGQAS